MFRKFVLPLALLVFAVAGAGGYVYYKQHEREQRLRAALALTLADDARLNIPRGSSLATIADQAEAALPIDAAMFIALAHRENVAKKLQAGSYRFAAGQTVRGVLRDLASGKVTQEKITLIEGKTFRDWRRKFADAPRLRQRLPDMSAADIITALSITLLPPEVTAGGEEFPNDDALLEGLFLADTYFFNSGDSDLSILRRAHANLQKTLRENWRARPADTPLKTPYQALVLASIIEKETGKASERPLIAAVFLNRLKARMRLQADPTVIYGLGDAFDGNLTAAHLRKINTPYNTYMRGGIPPTPIALTGKDAIRAALHPADSGYYYFVAKGDGSHHFSASLREHNNAVNRYQRRRRK